MNESTSKSEWWGVQDFPRNEWLRDANGAIYHYPLEAMAAEHARALNSLDKTRPWIAREFAAEAPATTETPALVVETAKYRIEILDTDGFRITSKTVVGETARKEVMRTCAMAMNHGKALGFISDDDRSVILPVEKVGKIYATRIEEPKDATDVAAFKESIAENFGDPGRYTRTALNTKL